MDIDNFFFDTHKPFKLYPCGKDYLWGGNRLNDDFSLGISIKPFAEAWLCSTHPDGKSLAVFGNRFVDLSELLIVYPEIMGSHPMEIMGGVSELPIIIKLIDAKQDLSVQVHPDDEYARVNEGGALGKTEMWYVLDAKPNSSLIYGFKKKVSSHIIRNSINNDTIGKYLNAIPVCKNNVFMVYPGVVHAIGSGCLIAEIQENSNITYRLYDYNRINSDGRKRDLHIERALDVLNMDPITSPRQPMRVLKYCKGIATELLVRCKYFQVERHLLNTETQRQLVKYRTNDSSFHALVITDGCGSICGDSNNGEFMINFFKGDCIFIPANSVLLKIHGRAQILDVSC